MITNGYATRAEFIAEIDDGSGSDLNTSRIDRIVEEASRLVDYWTNRHFYPVVETRYFTAVDPYTLVVPDLISLTELVTDWNNDGTYEVTWSEGTHYYLAPENNDVRFEPYSRIERIRRPAVTQWLPRYVPRGVKVTGKWGYYEVPRTLEATVSGAHTNSTTTLTPSATEEFSVGHLLKIGSEYLRVDDVEYDTLTVARNVNGSTAAALSGGEAIQALTFPGITTATLRAATRFWYLRKAPMGIATAGVGGLSTSGGGTRWIQQDFDLRGMISPFVKIGVGSL